MMLAAAAGGDVARVTRQAVKGSDAAVLRQELEDAEMKVEQCKVLIEFIDVFSVSLPIHGTLFLNAAVSTITYSVY